VAASLKPGVAAITWRSCQHQSKWLAAISQSAIVKTAAASWRNHNIEKLASMAAAAKLKRRRQSKISESKAEMAQAA